jgi:thiol-disulfide isomerase/thioredoxin
MSEPKEDVRARASPSAPRRRLLLAAAATAGATGLGLAWWRRPDDAMTPAAAPVGAADDAPVALWALTLARPEGGELALASLRGKPLLINFWATWCAPCVHELPEIERFHQAYAPKGWQVLGLAIDGPTPVREFLARVHVSFAIGLAGLDGTDLIRALGNPQGGLPFTVLLGANGHVLQRKLGETHYDELAGWARGATT